jgi:uncharacterized membrane protein
MITRLAVSLTLLTLVWSLSAQAQSQYHLIDLDTFVPVAISDHTLGPEVISNVGSELGRWSKLSGFKFPAPGVPALATGASNGGAIVGLGGGCNAEEGVTESFYWTEAHGFQCLLARGSDTLALGVNNAGEIVGRAIQDTGNVRGALYWPNAASPAENLFFASQAAATAINRQGVAIGWFTCDSHQPCQDGTFVAAPSVDVVVPLVGDFRIVAVTDDNDFLITQAGNGYIVAPFQFYTLGQPIGCTETAYVALNTNLQVIGDSLCEGTRQAWTWTPAIGFRQLTSVLNMRGWEFHRATAINTNGWIVGMASFNGVPHGYALAPVPPYVWVDSQR